MAILEIHDNKRMFTVDATDTDATDTNNRIRLDKFLASATIGMSDAPSRSRLRELIEQGQVSQQHPKPRLMKDPSYRVRPGDRFLVCLPEPSPAHPQPERIPLKVVHEDTSLIVIDKPAGLVVHPGPGNVDGTLVNGLLAHCGDSLTGIGGELRPGIVHRLDKDTSGLLVVAKTEPALKALQTQFAAHGRDGRLRRAYKAFVWGNVEPYKGSIDAPIGRSPHNRKKMSVRKTGGREAITHYQVLGAYGKPDTCVTELDCRLETGRTHQIRVHLTHIGHPLLGDRVYGGSQRSRHVKLPETARGALESLCRQALHAGELGFEHPETKEKMAFQSPLPDDLRALRSGLELI